MSGVNEIRTTFLDYFEKNGHTIVASSPIVPRNDPTLMFTNAGMVQFKNVFTGLESRDYSRAVTSQKCVRAGGKHNDLDNVGYTARHHTFFEMLGNFSFGDYFKEHAIELAWNLLTKEYGLPADRLLATVYAEDDQAYDLWKKIAGLPEDRIIRIATHDNFWAMGDTGPCGPCSEIFFDHGEAIPGGPPGSPDEDGDRFVEIWNLVFMQFEQVTLDERIDLPKPSIDTGMGLERVATVLQGVHSNYDTDLFQSLIRASVEATGVDAEGDHAASHRVIADHLRATSFLIADGVLPSNEGRGYVLRRIMRRAMRHGALLGATEPLLWKLVPALTAQMGQAYPELVRADALITETLKLEETRFRKTLARGLDLLSQASTDLDEGDVFDGETAFRLYDTYGFPLDLTEDALRQRQITVDVYAFNGAMEKQKAEARASWAGSGEKADETIWFELKEKHGATEFLGYATETAEGVVLDLVSDGKIVASAIEGDTVSVITNQTPFYAESGGQMGDAGVLRAENGMIEITDTKKRGEGLHVHMGQVRSGTVSNGDALELEVDHDRRSLLRSNHSATHLIHESLRHVLGDHVAQKGSLVAPERLRFDISHPKPVTGDEIQEASRIANDIVLQNSPVETRLMAVDDAIEAGAMALFGEKYGDEVRVVSMGTALEGDKKGKTYSLELCGGTHANRTGDIGLITVVGESAVAAGVRRIEALTGSAARQWLDQQNETLQEAASLLKVAPSDLTTRVRALVDERKKLERELADAKKALAMGGGTGEAAPVQEISTSNGTVSFMSRIANGIPAKELKGMVDEAKGSIGSGIVSIVGVSEDGKAGIVVGVTSDLTDTYSAVDLVRAGSVALGGKGGGGRPDMAQAGGPDASKADEANAAVQAAIAAG
ncbi:MAG: alanine--tRNA ligase [Pseudomonadota bacterium]